ncbi:hypothetical protein D3C86_1639380 [compost metagenome]
MLFSRPMPKNARHTAPSRGRRRPMMRQTIRSAVAARVTRSVTMVTGGNSLTATPMKKNDPPHRSESATSIAHSRASICFCIAIIISQSMSIDMIADGIAAIHPISVEFSSNRRRVAFTAFQVLLRLFTPCFMVFSNDCFSCDS